MSENDDRDPNAPAADGDPLEAFEAFRARRQVERRENEPFPREYLDETRPAAPEQPEAAGAAGAAAQQPGQPPEPELLGPEASVAPYAEEPTQTTALPQPGGEPYAGSQYGAAYEEPEYGRTTADQVAPYGAGPGHQGQPGYPLADDQAGHGYTTAVPVPYGQAPFAPQATPPQQPAQPGFVAPAEYAAEPPPPGVGFDFSGEQPPPPPPRPGSRRARSAAIFGIVAALVIGLGAAAYALAGSSSGTPAASSNPGTTAQPASGASTGPSAAATGKAGARIVLAKITVTSVDADSFTGTNARGETVTVLFDGSTVFGTATRPLTRAQLVPGAVVWVRGRRLGSSSVVLAGTIANGKVTTSPSPAAATTGSGV